MSDYTPARLGMIFDLVEGLESVAVELAREMRKRRKSTPRSRGKTLRPGVDTPLWNALVSTAKPQLAKRGAKTMLARELALNPSRVTEFFVKQSAMPDAERTLELLLWLVRRRR